MNDLTENQIKVLMDKPIIKELINIFKCDLKTLLIKLNAEDDSGFIEHDEPVLEDSITTYGRYVEGHDFNISFKLTYDDDMTPFEILNSIQKIKFVEEYDSEGRADGRWENSNE